MIKEKEVHHLAAEIIEAFSYERYDEKNDILIDYRDKSFRATAEQVEELKDQFPNFTFQTLMPGKYYIVHFNKP